MKNRITNRYFVVFMALNIFCVTTFSGCKTWNKTAKGGAIGAGAGGVVGGVIGAQSDNTILGTIIGAAIGGAAGAAIGRYMDMQAEELQKDLKGAKVERVGEGIRITFDTGILFDVDSYELKEPAKANIKELAETLKKYDDTNVLIEGHTDDTGSDEHNQTLSEKRAKAVAAFAKLNGIAASRIATEGYGEKQPVAENTSEGGRQKNRRVEIAIIANKKLKKAAEKGELGKVQ